jgi:hypothetical protein
MLVHRLLPRPILVSPVLRLSSSFHPLLKVHAKDWVGILPYWQRAGGLSRV